MSGLFPGALPTGCHSNDTVFVVELSGPSRNVHPLSDLRSDHFVVSEPLLAVGGADPPVGSEGLMRPSVQMSTPFVLVSAPPIRK